MEIKDAVQAAKNFLVDLFPEAKQSLRLEEVDSTARQWSIVFSYVKPLTTFEFISDGERLYKTVLIDRKSGVANAVKVFKI